jgi:hypothetical protein
MQRDFPYTNTTYNLILEYCSISRVRQYQQAYDAEKNGGSVLFDIRPHEKFVNTTMAFMSIEAMQAAKFESFYDRKKYVELLLSISNDKRINNFTIEAIQMIEDFNLAVPNSTIPKNEAYDDYFKDCYILTDLLHKNTIYYLENYFAKDLALVSTDKVEKELPPPIEEGIIESNVQVRFDHSAQEVVYLFKLLKDARILRNCTQKDISKVLARSFQFSKSSDKEQHSWRHIENMWALLGAQDAAEWAQNLSIMLDKAKEANPLNLKPKRKRNK